MSGVSPLDAFMSVKMGTSREFQLYLVWLQTWHLARFELDHPQGPDREGPSQQNLLRPF